MLPIAIYKSVTIASGQTTSDAVSCELITNGEYQLHAIEFPAAMTGATITFQGSRSSAGTYVALREVGGGANYPVTYAASSGAPVDPRVFATWPFLKIVSSSAEGADRTLVLHLRRIS
jgi:hypothetical protein